MAFLFQERNSYKELLDSYEHELTFTGGQFEKDKLAALEKVIATHKEIIEGLEKQLSAFTTGEATTPASTKELEEARAKVKELTAAVAEATEARERLQAELDRRAMRGDYDPTDTKVIQFR